MFMSEDENKALARRFIQVWVPGNLGLARAGTLWGHPFHGVWGIRCRRVQRSRARPRNALATDRRRCSGPTWSPIDVVDEVMRAHTPAQLHDSGASSSAAARW